MDITKVYPILIGKNLECCAKYKQNCFAAKRNHVILNQWHGTLYQQQIIRIAKQLWLLSFMNCLFYFEIFSKKHSLPLWPIPAFYIILLQSPPCLNCKSDVTSNQRIALREKQKRIYFSAAPLSTKNLQLVWLPVQPYKSSEISCLHESAITSGRNTFLAHFGPFHL